MLARNGFSETSVECTVSKRVSFGTDERLQSSDAPLSFEVIAVAQICNNHATVYVHELIAVSVQKANA